MNDDDLEQLQSKYRLLAMENAMLTARIAHLQKYPGRSDCCFLKEGVVSGHARRNHGFHLSDIHHDSRHAMHLLNVIGCHS